MSFWSNGYEFRQSVDLIHQLSECQNVASSVITANLELIPRWSTARKLLFNIGQGTYLHQLDPRKSAETFRRHLVSALATETFDVNPSFRDTCAKACDVFNRLIVVTNGELPPSQQAADGDLILDFQELIRHGPHFGRIEGNRDGAYIVIGPGRGMSREKYDRLFGPMIDRRLGQALPIYSSMAPREAYSFPQGHPFFRSYLLGRPPANIERQLIDGIPLPQAPLRSQQEETTDGVQRPESSEVVVSSYPMEAPAASNPQAPSADGEADGNRRRMEEEQYLSRLQEAQEEAGLRQRFLHMSRTAKKDT